LLSVARWPGIVPIHTLAVLYSEWCVRRVVIWLYTCSGHSAVDRALVETQNKIEQLKLEMEAVSLRIILRL